MHIRRDFYGDFRECLQCGLMQDLNTKIDDSTESEKVGAGQVGEKHEAA